MEEIVVRMGKNKLIPIRIAKRINDSHLSDLRRRSFLNTESVGISAPAELCLSPVAILRRTERSGQESR
jgi:hypothetical protein